MSAFPSTRLDSCCRIVSGATPRTAVTEYWTGDIPWATPKDLSSLNGTYIDDTERRLTPSGLASCSAELLPAGSVLLSSRAPIGYVAINTVPMATNQGFKSFVPNPDRIDPRYLYRWLTMQRTALQSLGNGATFKELSKTVVSAVEIPLPPLALQRRIADVLDQAELLLTKRRALLASLRSLPGLLFAERFSDHAAAAGAWPSLALREVLAGAAVFTDGDWVESKDQDSHGEVRLVQLADVGDGEFLDKSNRSLTRSKADELRCTFLETGDVLVARMPDPLGRACLYPGAAKEAVTVVDVCVIRPASSGPDNVWLAACLNSHGVRRQVERMATGTTRSRVSRSNLSRVRVNLPPQVLQAKYAADYAAIERLKVAYQRSLSKLEELFASLQYRAFRGEL